MHTVYNMYYECIEINKYVAWMLSSILYLIVNIQCSNKQNIPTYVYIKGQNYTQWFKWVGALGVGWYDGLTIP